MKLKPIIFGIAITAVLFCVLVATRMMNVTPATEVFTVREIQTVKASEPDEVDLTAEELPVKITPSNPVELSSAIVSNLQVSDVSLPEIYVTPTPELAVNSFSVDVAPAPLPVEKKEVIKKTKDVVKALPKPAIQPTSITPPKTTSKTSLKPKTKDKPIDRPIERPTPVVAKKSSYSVGEIDQKLALQYSPKVTFPRSVKDVNEGRVVVDIIILPSGKTKLVSVVSLTHTDFISLAKRLANGSRFSKPTYKGQPVTVTKRWPIVIRK